MPLAVDIVVPPNAIYLQQKIDDLESAVLENHAGKMFDAAKNLLETVFRTMIIDSRGQVSLQNGREPGLKNLFDQAKSCVRCFSEETGLASNLDELCMKAVQIIGYCRNNYGYASHGQDAYTAFSINPIEAVFIANVATSLVNFIYGIHVIQPTSYRNVRLIYGNFSEFNNYIDEINEQVTISGISMRPSETLFMTDQNAYRELLIEYTENPPESDDVNEESTM